MGITRRRFLNLTLVATLVAAFSLYVARYRLSKNQRSNKPLQDAPGTRNVDEASLATLLLASAALIGLPIEEGHYARFFQWRAENLYGHADVYRLVLARLRKHALEITGNPFIDCTEDERGLVVRTLRNYQHGAPFRKRGSGNTNDEQGLLEEFFFKPVLKLFASTDALIHLGYRRWPGEVRGLKRYQFHPSAFDKPESGNGKQG